MKCIKCNSDVNPDCTNNECPIKSENSESILGSISDAVDSNIIGDVLSATLDVAGDIISGILND